MKTTLILFLMISLTGFTQPDKLNELKVPVYTAVELAPGEKSFTVPVNFNQASLLNSIPDDLSDLAILSIDLVYSEYASSPDFDQDGLNQRRIKAFTKAWPASKNPMIKWNSIQQTQATSRKTAKNLFHGFTIYYRPKPTKESIEDEISFMDKYLLEDEKVEAKPVIEKVEPVIVEEAERLDVVSTSIMNPYMEGSDTKDMAVHEIPLISGYMGGVLDCYTLFQFNRNTNTAESNAIVDSLASFPDYLGIGVNWAGKAETKKSVMRTYTYAIRDDSCSEIGKSWNGMEDLDYGVVETVYERYPDWHNSLIVMDVTGSMSPYIAKTMAWVKSSARTKDVDAFVFFNDGNLTPDGSKKTGSVGGVYDVVNSDFKAVYNEMKSTMRKGGGGDCPENNVEATFKGIKNYPESDEIVMVADNWATPRDLSMVSQLKKPVHVILCGANYGVNVAYIQLAYDTGGSVHTIEEDLEARSIEPGKTFKMGRFYYTLLDGKLVQAEHK